MITLKCISCGATLRVPDDKAGKKGKCPNCRDVITVPTLPVRQDDEPGVGLDRMDMARVLEAMEREGEPDASMSRCGVCGHPVTRGTPSCDHCGTLLRGYGARRSAGDVPPAAGPEPCAPVHQAQRSRGGRRSWRLIGRPTGIGVLVIILGSSLIGVGFLLRLMEASRGSGGTLGSILIVLGAGLNMIACTVFGDRTRRPTRSRAFSWKSVLKWGLVVFFGLAAVATLMNKFVFDRPDGTLKLVDARTETKRIVASRLGLPQDCRWANVKECRTEYLGDNRYKVGTYVDWRTRDGTLVRTWVTCTLENPDGQNDWRLVNLEKKND